MALPEKAHKTTSGNNLLEIRGLKKSFQGGTIFSNIDISVAPGDCIGIVGGNGSGKTTFLNTVSNWLPLDDGQVLLNDTDINGMPAWRVAKAGMRRTFQDTKNVGSLGIRDNLLLAGKDYWRYNNWNGLFRREQVASMEANLINEAELIWTAMCLDEITRQKLGFALMNAGHLSLGEQRILELTRLFLSGSTLYLLDEPTTYLSSAVIRGLADLIRKLRGEGKGFLVVSHDVDFLGSVCNKVMQLSLEGLNDLGAVGVAELKPSSQPLSFVPLKGRDTPKDPLVKPVLRLEKLTVGYSGQALFSNIDLEIFPGEVVSFTGQNGCGKSTILATVMGLKPELSGDIFVDNTQITGLETSDRVRKGLSFLFQDRRVFPRLSVLENLQVAYTGEKTNYTGRLAQVFGRYPVLQDLSGRSAGVLSGGQQQMLAIGRMMMQDPRVILMDEPFSGLARAMREVTLQMIRDLSASGIAFFIVEHQVELIKKVTHRHYHISSLNAFRND